MGERVRSKYPSRNSEISGAWESWACCAHVASCECLVNKIACSESDDEPRSYSEAINFLYSLPTFSFRNQNIETFLAFLGATLQHRRDQIRFLDLCWVGLPVYDTEPRTPEHLLDNKWSYRRIGNIKALSELPDFTTFRTEYGSVYSEEVIKEILQHMKGLKKGGVNWGRRSTGCFAQEPVSSDLLT